MIQLLRLIHAASPEPGTDCELLSRYSRQRDEQAFAELVRRYGPSVWSACLRLTDRDAEDAFQAVFLTLARRADAVTGSLPAWLHGVTRRIAANLRRNERRRTVVESSAARPTESRPEDAGLREGLAMLAEELARLPDHYQSILIVCCLEGRSRDEAAAQLGWSGGQVKGRLERAREALRARLERRGVEVGGLFLAATLPCSASATPVVSTAIFHSTGLSPVVHSLSNGVIRTMFIQRLRVAAVAGLLVAAASGALIAQNLQPGESGPLETRTSSSSPPGKEADGTKDDGKTAPAELDPVASLRNLVERSEGASRTFAHEAEDKKWYRVRITAREVGFHDVKRTDSLVTPIVGEIGWKGETEFSAPCETEAEAAVAKLRPEVVKDPAGNWEGTFRWRDGRWKFSDAKFGSGQPTVDKPSATTPRPPTRRNARYWAEVFDNVRATSTAPSPTAEPVWGEPMNGLRLGVGVAVPGRVNLIIENVGKDDVLFNLGMMLGNGKSQLPTAVRLTFTDEAKKSRTFGRQAERVAGRVDPFVVPLPVGCRYTLACPLSDYSDIASPGVRLDPGAYRVSAAFTGGKNQDGVVFSYWTGELRSGTMPITVPKAGE